MSDNNWTSGTVITGLSENEPTFIRTVADELELRIGTLGV